MADAPSTIGQGRIIAHRGASRAAPENTLSAFREAARQGARWVELDVSLLGDGTAVIHHDATWDRCTNGSGALADAGAGDLAALDAGSWFGMAYAGEPVPTLKQTLDLLEGLGLFANLEMKPHGAADRRLASGVAAALTARPWAAERILVSSFDHGELAALRSHLPDQPIALLSKTAEAWVDTARTLRAAALHVHIAALNGDLLEEAALHGINLSTYTVNDPALVRPYRDRGLGGVITDDPSLFLDDPAWAAWGAH
ncbi:MAG: glycerophosphodiester phosphodiesterase family protein [Pseudomonadota bacterium]